MNGYLHHCCLLVKCIVIFSTGVGRISCEDTALTGVPREGFCQALTKISKITENILQSEITEMNDTGTERISVYTSIETQQCKRTCVNRP